MSKPIPDFVIRAQKEINSYGTEPITTIGLEAASVMTIIALLQLASRHPELPASHMKFAKTFVESVAKAFKPEHAAIQQLIAEGWKQEWDQELSA